MSKTKNRGHRETRKPRQEPAEVPDLGVLAMPRKTNRKAAKYVAEVGLLWDRRRVERKARKHRLRRQDAAAANPRRQHLDKSIRCQLLDAMPSWSFDHHSKTFVPDRLRARYLEELVDALSAIRHEAIVLRVLGLSVHEAARVRGYLNRDSALIVVSRTP